MVAAVALAVAYAASHLLLARGSLAVAARARAAARPYITGTYAPEPLAGEGEFRWTRGRAHFGLPAPTRWLVLRLWAHHPDIASNPVQVRVGSRCGAVAEPLRGTSGEPVTVVLALPERDSWADFTIDVSRTWRPADYGGDDTRTLGVGVATAFVEEDAALTQPVPPAPVCAAGG